jgi:hypothetical protein
VTKTVAELIATYGVEMEKRHPWKVEEIEHPTEVPKEPTVGSKEWRWGDEKYSIDLAIPFLGDYPDDHFNALGEAWLKESEARKRRDTSDR